MDFSKMLSSRDTASFVHFSVLSRPFFNSGCCKRCAYTVHLALYSILRQACTYPCLAPTRVYVKVYIEHTSRHHVHVAVLLFSISSSVHGHGKKHLVLNLKLYLEEGT